MSETPGKGSMDPIIFAGCYSPRGKAPSASIFAYRLNMTTGELSLVSAITGWENASYFAISPDNRLMVAVDESVSFDGLRLQFASRRGPPHACKTFFCDNCVEQIYKG